MPVKNETSTLKTEKNRCFGNGIGKELYAYYHDHEWGIPVHDDRLLFELLILEGAQAGLSWETILKRRAGYKELFHDFVPEKVAALTDSELEALLTNPVVIRNRLKIYGTRTNAHVFLAIQKEFGSFNTYLWAFVQNKPLKNRYTKLRELPTKTTISDALSRDLKKRGMTFVGSTIIYAYMQAVGMTIDHLTDCWKFKEKQLD